MRLPRAPPDGDRLRWQSYRFTLAGSGDAGLPSLSLGAKSSSSRPRLGGCRSPGLARPAGAARPRPAGRVKAFARGGMRLPVPAASMIGERSAHFRCPGFPCLRGLRGCADNSTLDWLTPIIHGHCLDACFSRLSWQPCWEPAASARFLVYVPGKGKVAPRWVRGNGNNDPISRIVGL